MATSKPNNVDHDSHPLTAEMRQMAIDELKRDLRRDLLPEFDWRLSNLAQKDAIDSGSPLPMSVSGNPSSLRAGSDVAREYKLKDDTWSNSRFNNISATNDDSDLMQTFTGLNAVIDNWLSRKSLSKEEKDNLRKIFFNMLYDDIKAVTKDKKEEYSNKVDKVRLGANSLNTSMLALFDQLQRVRSKVKGLPIRSGQPPFNEANFKISISLLSLSRGQLMGDVAIPDPYASSTLTPPPLIPAAINNQDEVNQYRAALSFHLGELEDEFNKYDLSGLQQNQESPFKFLSQGIQSVAKEFISYQSIVEDNLIDHANNKIASISKLSARADVLNDVENNLVKQLVDEPMSRQEKYSNVLVEIENNTAKRVYGQQWKIYWPTKTPSAGPGYVKGKELSGADYVDFYRWAIKNKKGLSPDQVEAVEGNSMDNLQTNWNDKFDRMKQELEDRVGSPLNRFNSKVEAYKLVDDYIKGVPLSYVSDLGVDEDERTLRLMLFALHFGISTDNTDSTLRKNVTQKLADELLNRIITPSPEKLKQVQNQNAELYRNRLSQTSSLWTTITSRGKLKARVDDARELYLDSSRTYTYENLMKKHNGKEIVSDSTKRDELIADIVENVMQNRLDMLNSKVEGSQTMKGKFLDKFKDFRGKRFLMSMGLIGGSLALGSILNPAVAVGALGDVRKLLDGVSLTIPGTIFDTFKSILFDPIAEGSRHFWGAGFLKGISSLAMTGGSGIATWMLLNKMQNNIPGFSESRKRSRNDVISNQHTGGFDNTGLGEIDSVHGTYKAGEVQSALAAQITEAQRMGASFASKDKNSFSKDGSRKELTGLIQSEQFKERFKTADYLWEQEKRGIETIVRKQVEEAINDSAVGPGDKVQSAISKSLGMLYDSSTGTEATFMKELEKQTNARKYWAPAKGLITTISALSFGSRISVGF